MAKRLLLALFVLGFVALLRADGPGDNLPDKVRPVPPAGIKLADNDRAELQNGVAALGKEIERLRQDLQGKPALLELLPDAARRIRLGATARARVRSRHSLQVMAMAYFNLYRELADAR